jgi:hypothetical protein
MLRLSASSRSVSDHTAVIARLLILKVAIARLTAGLLTGLLVAILASPLVAQRETETVSTSASAHESLAAYNVAHEMAFDGTVREAESRHETGSPSGLHLIVSGATGTVDAHLGPYMTEETLAALHLGLPVHLVGEMKNFNGKQIVLARLIDFGGHTVVVRNTHGALIHNVSHPSNGMPRTVKPANGGAR